jgi:hypothetical protein
MLFVLLLPPSAGLVLRSENVDDSFIKRVTDRNWTEVASTYRRFFVFVHLDNFRASDIAYLKYISIARRYQNSATFFVLPAILGEQVINLLHIATFPSLHYIHDQTYRLQLFGSISFASLERFVANATRRRIEILNIFPSTTYADVIAAVRIDEFDDSSVVFILANNQTRFGRMADKFAEIFPPFYRFIKIEEPLAGRLFGVRFPSIVLWNFDIGVRSVYEGDPKIADMTNWLSGVKLSNFRKFDLTQLVDADGVPRKIVLNLVGRVDRIALLQGLKSESAKFSKVLSVYADPADHRMFLSNFNVTKSTTRICILSDFFTIRYGECTSIAEFPTTMKEFKTPREVYGFVAAVDERGFGEFLKKGPVFAIFDRRDCQSCNDQAEVAKMAAARMASFGSTTNWVIWDVWKAVPNFSGELGLVIPSLYYFPSPDLSEGVKYEGKAEVLPVSAWAHELAKDFNFAGLSELEGRLSQYG